MKKAIIFILIILSVFSLCSCGVQKKQEEFTTDVVTRIIKEENTEKIINKEKITLPDEKDTYPSEEINNTSTLSEKIEEALRAPADETVTEEFTIKTGGLLPLA